MIGRMLSAASSVLVQFVRPSAAYRTLSDPLGALVATAAAAAVIAGAGFLPVSFTDWDQVGARLSEERAPELAREGLSPAQADSALAVELDAMRSFAGSFPMSMLLERSVIALIAALAAFGIAYAVEGAKVGRIGDYVTSSMLSQAAYSITASMIFLAALAVRLPGDLPLSLAAFVPTDTPDPGRLHVFLYRFLGSFDPPSAVSVLLWGPGLATLSGRDRGWGIRLCFSVFLLGALMISLPVMFAPSSPA